MKKTILYDKHIELGAKMTEFGGYLMPLEYTSITEEHLAVRNGCGLFDISHMGQISLRGPDAAKYANFLLTSNIVELSTFRLAYGVLTNPNGGAVDDLIVYKYNDEDILFVVNAINKKRDFEWIINHKGDYDVTITDLSPYFSALALQGPKSIDILQKFTDCDLSRFNHFDFRVVDMFKEEFIISRSGYTGEIGFEIYSSAEGIIALFNELIKEEAITLCGLGSRDTLRFEAGLVLYGNEIDSGTNPFELGLDFAVDLNKSFIGSKALKNIKSTGVKRKLIGLELLERGIARHGYEVYHDEKLIGYVTTGYMIPGTKKSYAMALINDLTLQNGDQVMVKIRHKYCPAVIRNKRFLNEK